MLLHESTSVVPAITAAQSRVLSDDHAFAARRAAWHARGPGHRRAVRRTHTVVVGGSGIAATPFAPAYTFLRP